MPPSPDSTSRTSSSSGSTGSGGERQRVGLARALLAPARLWLIDEPLSALDPARARQALDTLVGIATERGHTLVATMHDVDSALRCFPRIVGLREGRLVFDLPASEVDAAALAILYGTGGVSAEPGPAGDAHAARVAGARC